MPAADISRRGVPRPILYGRFLKSNLALPLSVSEDAAPKGPTAAPLMKLIIQIPCYNEAQTLAVALAALPRSLAGIDEVEWLVIDDGSTDNTAQLAREHGVDHVVRHPRNMGLAKAFMTGLNTCLALGADIIINTDADNQYDASGIPALVAPILRGEAEIVIGARPIATISHFSPVKKLLQRLGSWVVRKFSGLEVPDAPSGFRAMSRRAAARMNVFSEYTYTLETIIQAGQSGMVVAAVPVGVNDDLRPSRLVKSIPSYIWRSVLTLVRIYVLYKPARSFISVGGLLLGAGVLLMMRWLALFLFDDPTRVRAPSLIVAAVLTTVGVQLCLFGVIADLLAANRKLLEDMRARERERKQTAGADSSRLSRGDEAMVFTASSRSEGE